VIDISDTIVVTSGAGFIGSNCVLYWFHNGGRSRWGNTRRIPFSPIKLFRKRSPIVGTSAGCRDSTAEIRISDGVKSGPGRAGLQSFYSLIVAKLERIDPEVEGGVKRRCAKNR
jgi:hypothetical protein